MVLSVPEFGLMISRQRQDDKSIAGPEDDSLDTLSLPPARVVAIACSPPVGGNLREKVTANLFRDNQMRIYVACNGNIYRL
jgi:hypothetical protein